MSIKYGLAFDIGTTTITGGLLELPSGRPCTRTVQGKQKAFLTAENPQARFGEDIISRIDYCIKYKPGLENLHKLIIDAINSLIIRLSAQAGINKSLIKKAVIVGNTAMEHFFLKAQPAGLAEAPYASILPKGVIRKNAKKAGLAINKDAEAYILPIVKSFVGSDLTAGLLYTNLLGQKGANLLVDIGTNGEMALSFKGRLFAASTAAGCAFEAGDKGKEGSDKIEAVAFMLKNGIIDKSGRIKKAGQAKISQQDIRNIQLAKSAIMAGMLALVKKAGLGFEDIKNLYVAGKFGNFLNKEAAINIGLLPKIGLSKIKFVSNAAYKGAALALCSAQALLEAERIAKGAIHAGLFGDKYFKEEYVRQMNF